MIAVSLDDAIPHPQTYAAPQVMDALFAQLRREEPVRWTQPSAYRPFWTVSKHADVKEIERQPGLFTSAERATLFTIEDEQRAKAVTGRAFVIRPMIRMDGDEHRLYRGMTESWFTAASLKSLADRIAVLARASVDRMQELGESCDFVSEIAVWYPLRVIMMILGVDRADEGRLLDLTRQLFGRLDPEQQRRGVKTMSYAEVFEDFSRLFAPITADRRVAPRDDVVSVIANAVVDGAPIADVEAVSYYITLATAGHDTTSATIAGGLLALIENPAELAKLQAAPGLVTPAVDEMLRWTTPIRHFMRTAASDYVLRGTTIRAGDSVLLSYPSANRDEDVFAAASSFKVDRTPNPQLSFGFGPHLCLGLILAKMEIRAFYEALLPRLDQIELAGPPAWVETNFVGGLKHLPIRYRFK